MSSCHGHQEVTAEEFESFLTILDVLGFSDRLCIAALLHLKKVAKIFIRLCLVLRHCTPHFTQGRCEVSKLAFVRQNVIFFLEHLLDLFDN